MVSLGQQERFAADLAIRRVSYESAPGLEMQAEMAGELVEARVIMTLEMSSRLDPR